MLAAGARSGGATVPTGRVLSPCQFTRSGPPLRCSDTLPCLATSMQAGFSPRCRVTSRGGAFELGSAEPGRTPNREGVLSMSETPAEPSAIPTPAPAPPAAAADPAAAEPTPAREPLTLSIRSLLEAGVHFGHQTRRWNPRMKPFIFGERDGIHIIDLDQTLPRFREALDFLKETVAAGGSVLLVGTKRQAAPCVQSEAQRAGQFYVNNRWLGGMLTNFRTVKKSIERFKEMLEILGDEEKSAELSKKELVRVNREANKYRRSLDGIREMTRLPDALFVIDINKEHIAISEARRLGIPIVAITDSNCEPFGIDFMIPGNDDAIRAVQLYCGLVAQVCIEGAAIHNERIQAEVSEAEAAGAATPAPAAPSTGRVVVEISQPARRGRGASAPGGTRSAAGRRGRDAAASESAPAAGSESAPAAGETPAKPATTESKTDAKSDESK